MFRATLSLLLFGCLAAPLAAHEFWIEPHDTTLSTGDTLRPIVKIGTGFEGETFPFDARAYRQIIWTTSEGGDLRSDAQSPEKIKFTGLMSGLHILGVEANPQTLAHDTVKAFQDYIVEVGLAERIDASDPGLVPGGPIIERYQRFSKTLVHFDTRAGADRAIGLRYEWVKQSDGFLLLADGTPQADFPAFLFCRDAAGDIAPPRPYRTDGQGRITPVIAAAQTCLLNATFVSRQKDRSWLSAWTSLFFQM